jgi:hypothetical protein
VPEGKNIDIAHELHRGTTEHPLSAVTEESRRFEILEILEAILLAVVAIATAWSGYQSAQWDGRNALYYGQSSTYRSQASQLAIQGNQLRLYDVVTFNTWAQALVTGHQKLADFYVRRFSPEFRVAFDAWLKTDPIHHPQTAPVGPGNMPQYHNQMLAQSAALDAKSNVTFDQGTAARETSEKYLRSTVLLATVLFVVALSQRFDMRQVRLSLLGLGLVLLAVAVFNIAGYPIA